MYPYMFDGRGIIALKYVNDALLFGPKKDNTNEFIKEIEDDGL